MDELPRWDLFRSDGTAAGTFSLLETNPFSRLDLDGAPNLPGVIYFAAETPGAGYELWLSDGTREGTHLVDINPGTGSSQPNSFTVVGNALFFFADDGIHGNEPWVVVCPEALRLSITGPPTAVAGQPFSVTVGPRDADQQWTRCYQGTHHFVSSDARAMLPQDVAARTPSVDRTLLVTLKTAGTQTVEITDPQDAVLSGRLDVQVALGPPSVADSAVTADPVTNRRLRSAPDGAM